MKKRNLYSQPEDHLNQLLYIERKIKEAVGKFIYSNSSQMKLTIILTNPLSKNRNLFISVNSFSGSEDIFHRLQRLKTKLRN